MDPHPPLLLAANWEEIISFLVGAVVLLFWLIGQINQARKKPGPMMGPPAGMPPEAAPQPQPAPQAAPPADPLRAQIDEFLRRAQQAQQAGGPAQAPRREAAPAAPRPPVHEEIVVLLDEAPAEAQRQARAPVLRPVPEGPAIAPMKPSQLGRRPPRGRRAGGARPKSVADHVAENVAGATQRFREEVAHLGERVKHADEQFDVQLQQKFDHEVGSLAEGRTATAYDQPAASASDSPAAQIAAMLTTPDGARQAIVLNEILRRPDGRW